MRLRDYYLLFSSFYLAEGNLPPTSIPEANFFSLSLYNFISKLPVAMLKLI